MKRMAKYANAGELRTPIKFAEKVQAIDADGYPAEVEKVVLTTKCKWVNAHGTEVFSAMQQQLKEPATITMRYAPLVNQKLILYKGDDKDPYEVISVDDVEDRHKWMEIKVQRKTGAK